MTDVEANLFTRSEVVRFAHCDPAGIVFYPRYFELINNLVEDWFAALGVPFAEAHMQRHLGFPAATITTDFVSPSKIGEMLDKTLVVEKLGRSSLTLAITFKVGDVERLKALLVMVAADLRTYRSIEIPSDIRAAIVQFRGKA